jgi:hypothetical protein
MYLTVDSMRVLCTYINYDADVQDFTFDKSQGLPSISASIDEDDPPMFTVFTKNSDGNMYLTPYKSVVQTAAEVENCHIYCGTFFVAIGVSIYTPIGTTPNYDSHKANLKFELLDTRT